MISLIGQCKHAMPSWILIQSISSTLLSLLSISLVYISFCILIYAVLTVLLLIHLKIKMLYQGMTSLLDEAYFFLFQEIQHERHVSIIYQ